MRTGADDFENFVTSNLQEVRSLRFASTVPLVMMANGLAPLNGTSVLVRRVPKYYCADAQRIRVEKSVCESEQERVQKLAAQGNRG